MTQATLRNLLDAVRRTPGIPVIMGPTAAGKSELAFALARECGGEPGGDGWSLVLTWCRAARRT